MAVMLGASIAMSALALIGCLYLGLVAIMATRFAGSPAPVPSQSTQGVTLLKPLHGDEAGLFDNLRSFLDQDYAGPIEMVLGVQDERDPAIATVSRLRAAYPRRDIQLVVDTTMHGTNRKISNLINMSARIGQEVVVMADSDMRVLPDYLGRIVAALDEPGVGAVTCLYHGTALDGPWSRLFALAVDAQFLPNVLIGLGLNATQPCFGSTIAMRRETLVEIGGFAAVEDYIADDYAIGEAIRAKGYRISIPPFVITHVTGPMTPAEVWRHELRWARIVRSLAPLGYIGLVVTHPLPWALAALVLGGLSGAGLLALALVVAAVFARLALVSQISHVFGFRTQSCWLVPVRDLLSFAVFVASFFGRGVDWRGSRFRVEADGIGSLRKP